MSHTSKKNRGNNIPRKEQLKNAYQVNILLSNLEYSALLALGSPTAILRDVINQKAGDAYKIKQQIVNLKNKMKADQEQLILLQNILQETEEKNREEKQKKEEGLRNKNNGNSRKLLSKKEWIQKWKPEFVRELQEKGELHEINYKGAFQILGFKTKEEVNAWVRN